MRNLICLILICTVVLSCQKVSKENEYTCSYGYNYIYPELAFVGFSEAQLNQILIVEYTAGTNFNEWIGTDTIHTMSPIHYGDTLYKDSTGVRRLGFKLLKLGIDYKVVDLATQTEFRITEINEPYQAKTWTQSKSCSPGSYQARLVTCAIKINEHPIVPFDLGFNNYMVFIKR